MLKIPNINQIREADAYTITHEPIRSIDLMERAVQACVNWILNKYDSSYSFVIFCGNGNNGGDGLAIARLLLQNKYKVSAIVIGQNEQLSADCKVNLERIQNTYPELLIRFNKITDLVPVNSNTIVIDAIFGSGLSREVTSPIIEIIDWINHWDSPILSIDIPSGMFVDKAPKNKNAKCVNATYTLSFQFPKLSFMLPEQGDSVGELVLLDIGLHPEFCATLKTATFLLEKNDIHKLLLKRSTFSHKGTFGHALLIAGSENKMGAAVLSTHACLRSGAGLVTALVPQKEKAIIQISLPEAMLFDGAEQLSINTDLSKYTSIGIGPGLGLSDESAKTLKLLIQNYSGPCVYDADALNLIAANKTWLGFLRGETIFTPHLKEFERLTEKADNDFHRLDLAKAFAIKNKVHLVLKGKYTCICCPDGSTYFNPTGNPGMAKGGSGDILTGIITALLAQGYTAKNACLVGVYVHGLAGDIAAEKKSETAMIASDIIKNLPAAFLNFK